MTTENGKLSHDKIELRSEKVRQILGEVPGRLARWGIAIIAAVFALLLVAVLAIDYPYGEGESIFRHVFLM